MMDARSRADELREASNPLFNDRKLNLGTFCSNLSGGATMSSIDGILQAKWDSALALARMADEMEFEAIVPALEGLRRHHQFQRRRLRMLHLCRRHERADQVFWRLRHLARADHASGDGRQAGRPVAWRRWSFTDARGAERSNNHRHM
jgi:hypothetical protein